MHSSNYLSLSFNPRGFPLSVSSPSQQVNKDNKPEWLQPWFVWQLRSCRTCPRCGAHLYSNKEISLLPEAGGGAGTAWLGLLHPGEKLCMCVRG